MKKLERRFGQLGTVAVRASKVNCRQASIERLWSACIAAVALRVLEGGGAEKVRRVDRRELLPFVIGGFLFRRGEEAGNIWAVRFSVRGPPIIAERVDLIDRRGSAGA